MICQVTFDENLLEPHGNNQAGDLKKTERGGHLVISRKQSCSLVRQMTPSRMMAQGELHKYIQLIQVQGEHLVRCDEALVLGKLSLLKFECS